MSTTINFPWVKIRYTDEMRAWAKEHKRVTVAWGSKPIPKGNGSIFYFHYINSITSDYEEDLLAFKLRFTI